MRQGQDLEQSLEERPKNKLSQYFVLCLLSLIGLIILVACGTATVKDAATFDHAVHPELLTEDELYSELGEDVEVSDELLPTSQDALSEQDLDELQTQHRKQIVALCHYRSSTDSWKRYYTYRFIAILHLIYHQKDGQPHGSVAGMSGYEFDANCQPQEVILETICHFNHHSKVWEALEVSEQAARAHLKWHKHDAKPSDAVPGMSDYVFDETCQPVKNNNAPIAEDDQATVTLSSSITINVLANDGDTDGDALSIMIVTPPSKGSVLSATDQGVPIFIYTPSIAEFPTGEGTDSFTYKVSDDEGASDTAMVTITVEGIGAIAKDDTATLKENEEITVIDIITNDLNGQTPDNIRLVMTNYAGGGRARIDMDNNFALTFEPLCDFNYLEDGQFEDVVFTYRIGDITTGIASEAAVMIRVEGVSGNSTPLVQDDFVIFELSNETINLGPEILTNDCDGDFDALSVEIGPDGAFPSKGTIDSQLVYTPTTLAPGETDTFTYQLSDGLSTSEQATVTIFGR